MSLLEKVNVHEEVMLLRQTTVKFAIKGLPKRKVRAHFRVGLNRINLSLIFSFARTA